MVLGNNGLNCPSTF